MTSSNFNLVNWGVGRVGEYVVFLGGKGFVSSVGMRIGGGGIIIITYFAKSEWPNQH